MAAALEEASGGADARDAELQEKTRRVHQWMEHEDLQGVLLRRHENVAWVTGGQVEARVGILSATGVVALLLLRDGRRLYLAPNNEADRLAEEEFAGLSYEPLVRAWHALDLVDEARRIAGGTVASDDAALGLPVASLGVLRAPLTASEMERYRRLAGDTARIVSTAALALEPGVTERDMEADMAGRLLTQGIFPSVLLMATDERILRYKHAVAREGKLRRFGMLNLCTRRWGLAVSITRFVHFGPLPAELQTGFAVAARVNAALQHATRKGASARTLLAEAARAYAEAGFAGEEQRHHQGGACGYLEREWVATPTGTETVTPPQAFAWNPSCRGGKVEDTTLVRDTHTEVLTLTPHLPQVHTQHGRETYVSAGPLIRT